MRIRWLLHGSKSVKQKETIVIIGTGAAVVAPQDAMVVYADMARWEIQQRFRRHEVKALGIDNRNDAVSLQYKRGYFNDWRVCDRYKERLFDRVEFWIDTHVAGTPKMIDKDTFFKGGRGNGEHTVPGSSFLRSGSPGVVNG